MEEANPMNQRQQPTVREMAVLLANYESDEPYEENEEASTTFYDWPKRERDLNSECWCNMPITCMKHFAEGVMHKARWLCVALAPRTDSGSQREELGSETPVVTDRSHLQETGDTIYIHPIKLEEWTFNPPHEPASDPNYVKHVQCEGARFHVLSYSGGSGLPTVIRCSEPRCIINKSALPVPDAPQAEK